jgi:glycosyltransferase involved in cell wall biosynthesis
MITGTKSKPVDSASPRKPLPLSVAVITLNEENNLARCLNSVVGIAAEIIVVDSGSTDGTRSVAASFNATFEVHPWQGHIAQKNFALSRCGQPWVLCLDADEALSPEAAAEISDRLSQAETALDGFWINRRNFYLGQWIRHAWNPEWRLRLARRERAHWGGLNPHDKLEVNGPTERLKGRLLHHPFESLSDHLATELKYARIMADSLERSGRVFRWYQVIFSPFAAWLRVLIFKSGWRDGWRGWFIAGAKWMGTFAKYAFMVEQRWTKKRD